MKTGSLRLRVSVVTLIVLSLVLVGVVIGTTLAYRSSLQRDLHRQLSDAESAFRQAWPSDAAKQLITSLTLQGIATDIQSGAPPIPADKAAAGGPQPVKPGLSRASTGSLLAVSEELPDGTRVTFSASRARIDHAVDRLLVVEILVALAALGLAALALRRATGAALSPLTQIAETATQIAAGKTARLNPNPVDTDLGRMAAAFDRMVGSLEAAAARAQSSESAMRRFLADASHELRTPAAALQANAETLLREQPERPERDRIEARLAQNAARLGRLVDDLLNLARIDANEPLTRKAVDLVEVARQSVQESAAHADGVEVAMNGVESTWVLGNAEALSGALRNLVDNALVAAGSNGHVGISVQASGADAEVRVLDDGPGIPETDRTRIFERFVRLDEATAHGTGLGLAIAREIARQHGGDITCDAVVRGGSFTLHLPIHDPTSAATLANPG